MKRKSSDVRSHPSRACSTIAASRWQTVPVVIWRTGAPLVRRRTASLSVARSPTRAATRARAPRRRRVSLSSAVFPAPGLETRPTTQTPASANRARRRAASASFLASTFRRTSTIRGGKVVHLQRRQFDLPSVHKVARRRAADGTEEAERFREDAFRAAAGTEDRDRHPLDDQARAVHRRAAGGQVEREAQRLFDDR